MSVTIRTSLEAILYELQAEANLKQGSLLVIGASTSEIAGERIGSAGSEVIAADVFHTVESFREQTGCSVAYQGCEHINRALVVDREYAERRDLEIVSLIPARRAGGAVAAYAYANGSDPVVVEKIRADAGVDIGSTLIGMHLKPVAVPLRAEKPFVGEASVTMARTRPKYIGGPRTQYE
ncbi:uncharacterized protein (TIGR01440 family) [Geomicrobium halophilum]|uniref:UPF0340 protein HNR44_002454 n=1 Tax=Geomicrobium halophilum TaxID=549000 RepID=A0A841PVT3_9BACL|nr:TIGR01440 family protein [Geomicrobium halophilum]MBB6450471.1 uncharacterized protein (TIGR01440 family) [Geomicrobium halophilum]